MDLKQSYKNSGNINRVYWNLDNIGCIIDQKSAEKLWYISNMKDEPCALTDEYYLVISIGKVFDPYAVLDPYTNTKSFSCVLMNSDGQSFHLDLPVDAYPASIHVSRLAYHLD